MKRMTREEAIKVLNMVEAHGLAEQAKQMAISAMLENEELSKDLDEALKEIDMYERGLSQACVGSTQKHVGNALDMRCDDAVNRQAVLNILLKYTLGESRIAEELRELPPVTQKSGKRILLDECANSGYYCSNCQKKLVKEGWSQTVKKIKYCPNCGAKMERSDKE